MNPWEVPIEYFSFRLSSPPCNLFLHIHPASSVYLTPPNCLPPPFAFNCFVSIIVPLLSSSCFVYLLFVRFPFSHPSLVFHVSLFQFVLFYFCFWFLGISTFFIFFHLHEVPFSSSLVVFLFFVMLLHFPYIWSKCTFSVNPSVLLNTLMLSQSLLH